MESVEKKAYKAPEMNKLIICANGEREFKMNCNTKQTKHNVNTDVMLLQCIAQHEPRHKNLIEENSLQWCTARTPQLALQHIYTGEKNNDREREISQNVQETHLFINDRHPTIDYCCLD